MGVDCKTILESIPGIDEVQLLHRLSSNEYALGKEVQVPTELIPATDRYGRWTHIVGFLVEATQQFDTVAATMTAAYSGRRLFGALSTCKMKAAGGLLDFLPDAFDARRLFDMGILIEGFPLIAAPIDLADADATNTTKDLNLLFRFGPSAVQVRTRGEVATPLDFDGAIPAVLMNRGKKGHPDETFQFTLASALPGAPAGVTYDGFTKLNIYALLRHDKNLVLDAAWRLREEVPTETVFEVAAPELGVQDSRNRFCVIRHVEEDTGALDNSDYSSMSIKAGSNQLYGKADLSAAELETLMAVNARGQYSHRDAGSAGVGANLTQDALDFGNFTPLNWTAPGCGRAEMARGPFNFKCARATHTSSRVLSLEYHDVPEGVLEVLANRTGIPMGKLRAMVRGPKEPTSVHPSILPRRIGAAA